MPKKVADTDILDAAIGVMIAHGYVGATTKLIADAAGINEVTLFRKFGNKAQLLLAAVAREAEVFDEGVIQYTGDIAADLQRIVTTYNHLLARRGRFFPTILSEIPRRPELKDGFKAPLAVVKQIGALLSRYQEEGILREENPLHAVASLIGPIIITGALLSVDEHLPISPLDPETHVATFLNGRYVRGDMVGGLIDE